MKARIKSMPVPAATPQEAYEMLKSMNDNLRSPASGVNACIYNAFGADAIGRKERCAEHQGSCAACITALLSEGEAEG